MGNIVLLDELTINKIAAGEVVERPASVVKEMIENSIDAGATNINVEIRNGGISYIRIADNGKGIAKDDLELAFERHATSKIRSANDLDSVKSMGFRGEALASIAAIANVEMVSKTKEDDIGNKIVVEAGNILLQEEVGCQNGTTITVQNLFFNTPVRYKFLKKDYTESGYIEDVITRLALIHPEIAFKLINTGKTVIQTSGNGDLQDAIYSIFGKDIASAILKVDYIYEDVHITGVVGKPEIARSNRANQLFFVNKRYVKDKTLTSGVESAFQGLLPIGKYGFLVLNVEIEPSKVDVNVHPAKLEVRFQEENKIFKAVYHAIKDTLLKAELIENVQKDTSKDERETIQKEESKPSITDLFRKISAKAENENKSNNLIEDVYLKRENTLKEPEKKVEEIKKEDIRQETNKMDLFKELLEMQQRLKEEAENNPNLHTNIDKLIEDTKNITNNGDILNTQNEQPKNLEMDKPKEEEITENKEEAENETVSIQTSEQTENEIANNEGSIETKNEILNDEQNLEIKEEVVNNEQNEKANKDFELKEYDLSYLKNLNNINNTEIREEQEEYEKNDNVQLEENNQPNIESTEKKPSVHETRTFTSDEIQEMIEKLKNVDDAENNPEFISMYEKIFGRPPVSVEAKKKQQEINMNAFEIISYEDNISVFETEEELKKPTYKLIGIAFNTYIIIEIGKELYIIDQHAAHERIMYEKVKANYYSDSNKDSQMLLLPDIITLTHKEMDILVDNEEMFEKAGFVIEEFGDNTIKLTGVPNICLDLNTKELFLETLDEINTVARTAKQEIEEKFIATVACKAAVKAHMSLSNEEVDNLMNELLKLPNPFTCPHGRPTAIKMDQSDIEKKFARRK